MAEEKSRLDKIRDLYLPTVREYEKKLADTLSYFAGPELTKLGQGIFALRPFQNRPDATEFIQNPSFKTGLDLLTDTAITVAEATPFGLLASRGATLPGKVAQEVTSGVKPVVAGSKKGKVIQTGDETTEGTFRYRGKTYNKSDGVLVEFDKVLKKPKNKKPYYAVNKVWTPKESYGTHGTIRETKFTKNLDLIEPIIKKAFSNKNLHLIKKDQIADILAKEGYTDLTSTAIASLKKRIMGRSATKEEIRISRFISEQGDRAGFSGEVLSSLSSKNLKATESFITNISTNSLQKNLLRNHMVRMISQARNSKIPASDAEIIKVIQSYNQKKLKEFFKMDEELRKLNKQASDMGINPTIAGRPYAINISHKKPTSVDWKGAFDPDNMFFSDNIGNIIKQPSIEKQIERLRDGIKNFKNLSEKKKFAQTPIAGYKGDVPRNIKEARQALEDEKLISRFDKTQYGKADPNDPYFKQAMADKIVKRIIEGRFNDGGIVGINNLIRPLGNF